MFLFVVLVNYNYKSSCLHYRLWFQTLIDTGSFTAAPVCAPSAHHEPEGNSSLSSDDEEDNECKEQRQDWKGRHRAQRLKGAQNNVLWGAPKQNQCKEPRIPSGATVWDYHVCWCKSVCERVFGTLLQARCRVVFLWASCNVKSALALLTSTSDKHNQHLTLTSWLTWSQQLPEQQHICCNDTDIWRIL